MKGTENFKNVISKYLEEYSKKDTLFLERFKNESKNIDDCIVYILNTVKNSGCQGFEDDEIFNMAIHYYDEDEIEIGNPINGKCIVNHIVQLTEEEINKAKEEAINKVISEEKERLRKKSNSLPLKKEETKQQISLF